MIAEKQSQLGEVKVARSERSELVGQLYDFYLRDNKIQNWKGYIKWLKENKLKDTPKEREKFKKTKGSGYFTPPKIESFAWLISHIPTGDLYYLVSIAKDKENRKESFARWLYWSLKAK